MIKLPEPYMVRHEDVCGDEVGPPTPCYTEAQLKQAVRDAYEDAAKTAEALTAEVEATTYADVSAVAIRALIKEIPA